MRRRNSDLLLFIILAAIITGLILFLKAVHKRKLWKEFLASTSLYMGIGWLVYTNLSTEHFPVIITILTILYIIYWVCLFNFYVFKGNSNKWLSESFWRNLDPFEFEDETAALFRALGHKAKVTPERGDYGVDVIVVINGVRTAIQCKRYNGHKVTCEEVRDLWGAKDYYNCSQVIMIGLDGVTRNANNFVNRFKGRYKILTLKDLIWEARGIKLGKEQRD